MKIKTLLIAVLAVAASLSACSKKVEKAIEDESITVDSVMAAAPRIIGTEVLVEGTCSHICSHGGRKAFLVGADSSVVLRCQATAGMEAFTPECPGRQLVVRGIVREDRLTEADIAAMEERQAKADSAARAHGECAHDKQAQGQTDCDSFEARMADFRARIAERNEAEGKDYLSFYYLDALSYYIDERQVEDV